MNRYFSYFTLLALSPFSSAYAADSDNELRLNHIQVLGSHNSYKKAIDLPLLLLLKQRSADVAVTLEYWHSPLQVQLDAGLRKLELDVFYDPEGGRYAKPFGTKLPFTSAYDPEGEMRKPGFKVMHVQDIDFRSHCYAFKHCLQTLHNWSTEHPKHLPIIITLNAKDDKIDRPDFTKPLPFDTQAFDALDAEIRDIIPASKLITPDDVRGQHPTLEQAVLAKQWPTLEDAKGKFMFVLDETGDKQAAYIKDHPALKGRIMFVNAPAGQAESAFLILNDPVAQQDEIKQRVQQGYLVRTRSDAETREARANDTKRAMAAFSSGAQFVSTDYYLPAKHFDSTYQVKLPDESIARCNPVNAPKACGETLSAMKNK